MLGLAVAAVLALPGTLSAQVPPGRAALVGHIVDSEGQPIEGADIMLLDLRAQTDVRGAFRLRGIPAGTHEVAVRHVGHAPLSLHVAFAPDDTLVRRLVLTRIVELDSVLITARKPGIPGFDERRAQGGGRFITREELEKLSGRKMTEVLRRVPGLRVTTNLRNRGEAFVTNSRGAITMLGSNPACYVHVYMDDFPMYTGGYQPPYNMNQLSANEIEAVEYYQGGAAIPAKYNRPGSVCGVLVLWTRR